MVQWLALVDAGEKCVHVLYINMNVRNLTEHNRYIHDTLPSATKVNQHLSFFFLCLDWSTFDSRLRDEDPRAHGNPKICDQLTLVC